SNQRAYPNPSTQSHCEESECHSAQTSEAHSLPTARATANASSPTIKSEKNMRSLPTPIGMPSRKTKHSDSPSTPSANDACSTATVPAKPQPKNSLKLPQSSAKF